jgi:anthranilate phosphoribosyltransferase
MLGPLLNPGEVKKQLTGVYDRSVFELYERVFRQTDNRFGIIFDLAVYDEISLTGDFMFSSHFPTADEGELFSPSAFDLKTFKQEDLHGGVSLEESAQILINILENKGTEAQTSVVLANAALGLCVAKNLTIEQGMAEARVSLESGKAREVLRKLAS